MTESTLEQSVVAYLRRRVESETDEEKQHQIQEASKLLGAVFGEPSGESDQNQLEQLFVEGQQALRRRTYHSFLRRVSRNGFFDGTVPGSEEFDSRLERARRKYLSRHPTHTDATKQSPPLDIIKAKKTTTAEAEPEAEQAVEEEVKEVSQADKDRAMALKNEGNALLKKRKLDQALAKYAEASKLWPTNGIFFANRAAVFSMQKKFEKSEAEARRAVEVDPGYRKGHTRLASALEWQGRLDDAASVLANALAMFQDDTAAIEKQLRQVEDKIEAREGGTTGSAASGNANTANPGGTGANTGNTEGASGNPPFGGMGGLSGLMAGLGGMGGNAPPGGLGGLGGMLGGLMQNPAVMQSIMNSPMLGNLRQSNPDLFDEAGAPRADAINQIMADPALMSKMMEMAGPLLGSMFGGAQQ